MKNLILSLGFKETTTAGIYHKKGITVKQFFQVVTIIKDGFKYPISCEGLNKAAKILPKFIN